MKTKKKQPLNSELLAEFDKCRTLMVDRLAKDARAFELLQRRMEEIEKKLDLVHGAVCNINANMPEDGGFTGEHMLDIIAAVRAEQDR